MHSFKTKGNLTKHMKSKAHYKKCKELGLNPLPPSEGMDDGMDDDNEGESMTSGDHTSTMPGDDSDSDDMSDGDGYSSGRFRHHSIRMVFMRQLIS